MKIPESNASEVCVEQWTINQPSLCNIISITSYFIILTFIRNKKKTGFHSLLITLIPYEAVNSIVLNIPV